MMHRQKGPLRPSTRRNASCSFAPSHSQAEPHAHVGCAKALLTVADGLIPPWPQPSGVDPGMPFPSWCRVSIGRGLAHHGGFTGVVGDLSTPLKSTSVSSKRRTRLPTERSIVLSPSRFLRCAGLKMNCLR
jgi:hypothetical protein